jgi:hypothetical protein
VRERDHRARGPLPHRHPSHAAAGRAGGGVGRRRGPTGRAGPGQGWAGARFALTVSGDPDALVLHAADGTTTTLDEALGDADVVVLVASASGAGELARSACVAIGDACFLRGTMTAGIVLDDAPVEPAVALLRPHARVLLITSDEGDLSELLTALRA